MPARIFQTYSLAVFLCLPAARLSAQSDPLNQRVTLELRGYTLAEAFTAVEQATGLAFTYSAQHLPGIRLSLRFEEERLKKVLSRLLEGTGLAYTLSGNHIVVFQDKTEKEEKPSQYTISGYIRDASSGEELIGCYLTAEALSVGTASNAYGFYSLTLPEGQYRLKAQYLGYIEKDTLIGLRDGRRVDLALEPSVEQLEPVIISATIGPGVAGRNEVGAEKLEVDILNELPGLYGEQDVMLSLQMMPGVLASGDANGPISVRGGAPDQNLILLDEAPVYYESHMLGIFSIFNPDVVKQVELHKGHIPAQYQGRLSSVLDVRTQEGNKEKVAASGGVGLIASRLKVEGPLGENNGSFLLAARASHISILNSVNEVVNQKSPFNLFAFPFRDLNLKTNIRIGKKNRFFLSGYLGGDNYRPKGRPDIDFSWGNRAATLRWNHLFNQRVFSNTSLVFSAYYFDGNTLFDQAISGGVLDNTFGSHTHIREYQLKEGLHFYPSPNHTLRFGGAVVFREFGYHTFPAGALPEKGPAYNRDALEFSAYLSHEWRLGKYISIEYGAHLSHFTTLGTEGYVYAYDQNGARIDSSFYRNGQAIQRYFRAEPRVALSLAPGERHQFILSFNRTHQYLQRLSSALSNSPASVWLPSGPLIRPQGADQWSLGYKLSFDGLGGYEASLGLYTTVYHNQIAFRNGAALDENAADLESLLVFGKGRARGMELMLRKNQGAFRGWVSYTLSSSRASFDAVNDGQVFPNPVDRPHELGVVAIWDVNDKIVWATRWLFYSGNVITLPEGKYTIDGLVLDYYGQRNQHRLDAQHRLDISLTVYRKGVRDRGSSLNISLLNIYGRQNPSFVYLKQNSSPALLNNEDKTKTEVRQVSFLPTFLPSLTYNFRF